MATLILKDSNESCDFLDNTNYVLQDDTFRMSPPNRVELKVTDNFFAGRDLERLEYGPREITFEVRVEGASQLAVSSNVSKIQRLLTRASSSTYLQGGAYNQSITFTQGSQTGDHGVILQVRRGSDSLGNVVSEYSNDNETNQGLYTIRVISGDLEVSEKIFGSADVTGDGKYFRYCRITLQVEPFILGPVSVISTTSSPGFRNEPYYNTGHTNRLIIQAASVPGEVDALTRIGTELNNAQGIIIARDAGISLLNCPSYPSLDTGKDDVFVYGQLYDTANRSYKININGVGTPNTFRFSHDNGSTWGPTTNIVAWTPIQLRGSAGLISAYALFGTTTGFTNNQTWSFSNHQSYFRNTGSYYDGYDNRNTLMSDLGLNIYTFYVNVPPGCRSKYKVFAHVDSDILCEYRMRVNFVGRASATTRIDTEPQYFDWTGPYNTRSVDLGIIDLTSNSVPFMSHPYAMTVMRIQVYARAIEDVTTDNGDNLNCLRAYLIPVQDEFSYFHAGWKNDGTGTEVYSNFDAANPYIAEEAVNLFDGDLTGRFSIGLDATYGGNVITLVPNVIQTLMFIPLLSVNTDWRSASLPTNGETGNTYVAIRPRYLHIPG